MGTLEVFEEVRLAIRLNTKSWHWAQYQWWQGALGGRWAVQRAAAQPGGACSCIVSCKVCRKYCAHHRQAGTFPADLHSPTCSLTPPYQPLIPPNHTRAQATPDAVYPGALEAFANLGRVVDSLMGRTAKLTAAA